MVTWRWWWVLVVETIWFATLSYQLSYSIFGLRLGRVSKECYWSYKECQKLGKLKIIKESLT